VKVQLQGEECRVFPSNPTAKETGRAKGGEVTLCRKTSSKTCTLPLGRERHGDNVGKRTNPKHEQQGNQFRDQEPQEGESVVA